MSEASLLTVSKLWPLTMIDSTIRYKKWLLLSFNRIGSNSK